MEEYGPLMLWFIYQGFDIFMFLFTILLGWGLYNVMKSPYANRFTTAFCGVSFVIFLGIDVLVVMSWFGYI